MVRTCDFTFYSHTKKLPCVQGEEHPGKPRGVDRLDDVLTLLCSLPLRPYTTILLRVIISTCFVLVRFGLIQFQSICHY